MITFHDCLPIPNCRKIRLVGKELGLQQNSKPPIAELDLKSHTSKPSENPLTKQR